MSNYPNNNGYDNSNNNGYGNPNINGYGNPNNSEYGNNPYNQNYNRPSLPENLLSSIKKVSIVYIILFFLTIILTIAGCVLLISWSYHYLSLHQYNDYYYNYEYENDLFLNTDFLVSVILIAIGSISGLLLFIVSIFLTVKSERIRNYSNDFDNIFILSIVGIFVGLCSLIASFIAISKVNKLRK